MTLVSALMATSAMASIGLEQGFTQKGIEIEAGHTLTLKQDLRNAGVITKADSSSTGAATITTSESSAAIYNIHSIQEDAGRLSNTDFKTKLSELLGDSAEDIQDVYTIGDKGRVDSSVTLTKVTTDDSAGVMTSFDDTATYFNSEIYGDHRLFNLLSTEAEQTYKIDSTSNSLSTAAFVSIPVGEQKAVNLHIFQISDHISLGLIRGFDQEITLEDCQLSNDGTDLTMQGKFKVKESGYATIDASNNVITFANEVDVSKGTSTQFTGGKFVFLETLKV